jgi:hypothetical protein
MITTTRRLGRGKKRDVCLYFNCRQLITLEYRNRTSQEKIKRKGENSYLHHQFIIVQGFKGTHHTNTIKWKVHRSLS